VKKIAQRLELAHVAGERAGGWRLALEAHAHHMLEQAAGEHDIGALAGRVDEIAARRAQHEVERHHDEHADRKHPQGLDGIIGNDAVVDVHREQRCRQREDVDDE